MAGETKIEWTDFSSNVIKFRRKDNGKQGHACVKVSPACTHCYAERMNKWTGTGLAFTVSNMEMVEPFLDEKELKKILKSRKMSGKRVFIEDMSDLFGDWVPFEWLDMIFTVFAMRPDITFQVLTKRPERALEYFQQHKGVVPPTPHKTAFVPWPLPNVWIGVTVENQKEANKRIPILQKIPAAVRFLSCEPLLGDISLPMAVEPDEEAWDEVNAIDEDGAPEEFVEECEAECDWINYGNDLVVNPAYTEWERWRRHMAGYETLKHGVIDLVIAGGESGGNARISSQNHFRFLLGTCKSAGIKFFFKQWGEYCPVSNLTWVTDQTTFKHRPIDVSGVMMVRVGKALAGRMLDGQEWNEMPGDAEEAAR